MNSNFYSSSETKYVYNLKDRAEEFYGDWLIVDTLNSINGPSDWNLRLNENNGKYILTQNSSIKQIPSENLSNKPEIDKNYALIASSLILKNFSLKHLHSFYSNIIFQSNSYGLIQFNFRYKDYQNYLAFQLERKSNDEGFIKLIQLKENNFTQIESLECDKMMSILEKCYGYDMNKENFIEILSYEDILQIKFNKFLIFNLTKDKLKAINFYDENFVLSINNQNNLIISQLIIREMNEEEKTQIRKNSFISSKKENSEFENFSGNSKNNFNDEQIKNEKQLVSNEITSNNIKQQIKQNLKYNPKSNKFEFQDAEIPSTPISSEINKEMKEKNYSQFDKESFKKICLKHEKEEYVCNYITNIVSSHKININEISQDHLIKLIRSNCISMMKNNFVCDQILNKLEPIIRKLKSENLSIDKSKINSENISLQKQKILNTNQREISNLIKACSFEFLPNLLKNRKICLNDIMKKELKIRESGSNDECVKEFCINCCFINYGNSSCKICE